MEKLALIIGNMVEHFWNLYADDAANALLLGLLALLGYLGNNIKNAIAKDVFDKAVVAVKITGQTIVDDLKAASADVKLTDEDKAKVKAHAKEVFLAQFSIVGKMVGTLVMGSLNSWFEKQAEYIIAELKKKLPQKSSNE